MLAALATACRPHGAPRWDAPGVVAAIGKVKHLSLADVILAVIRAADDREARTPGVIGNTRSVCWQERSTERPRDPEILAPGERCGICAHQRHDGKCPRCAPIDDHAFEPDFKRDTGIDVPATVGSLRDMLIDAKAHTTRKPATAPDRETTPASTDRTEEHAHG